MTYEEILDAIYAIETFEPPVIVAHPEWARKVWCEIEKATPFVDEPEPRIMGIEVIERKIFRGWDWKPCGGIMSRDGARFFADTDAEYLIVVENDGTTYAVKLDPNDIYREPVITRWRPKEYYPAELYNALRAATTKNGQ